MERSLLLLLLLHASKFDEVSRCIYVVRLHAYQMYWFEIVICDIEQVFLILAGPAKMLPQFLKNSAPNTRSQLRVPFPSSFLHQTIYSNQPLCHELLASYYHQLHCSARSLFLSGNPNQFFGLKIRLCDCYCYSYAANRQKASHCAPPTNSRPCMTHALREHLLQKYRWWRTVRLPFEPSDFLISPAAILPLH